MFLITTLVFPELSQFTHKTISVEVAVMLYVSCTTCPVEVNEFAYVFVAPPITGLPPTVVTLFALSDIVPTAVDCMFITTSYCAPTIRLSIS